MFSQNMNIVACVVLRGILLCRETKKRTQKHKKTMWWCPCPLPYSRISQRRQKKQKHSRKKILARLCITGPGSNYFNAKLQLWGTHDVTIYPDIDCLVWGKNLRMCL